MFKQNKNKTKILTALAVFASISIFASSKILAEETKKFGVDWGGWVRMDMYWDSRATIGARESTLMFLPSNEELNTLGHDTNAVPSFYWGPMSSRLNAKITAPDFLQAKVSGYVEAEFVGQTDDQTNVLRMRHAYVDLDWGTSKLLIGQTWNPMFIPETILLRVSANGAAPVGPLVRDPQIRFTQYLTKTFSVQATAYTEREMRSVGPGRPTGGSVKYQKDALLPAFNLLFKYKSLDNKFIVGANGELQTIKPYNFIDNYKVDETLSTITASCFLGYEFNRFSVHLNGYYGGNMANMTMPGGYAVTNYPTQANETIKYTPFNNLAVTADIDYTVHKNLKVGVFCGINMNLGTTDEIDVTTRYDTYTAWNAHVDKLFRVSPRAIYQVGKFQIGAEVEYTQAAYGKVEEIDGNKWQGKWKETSDFSNLRFLVATTLFF